MTTLLEMLVLYWQPVISAGLALMTVVLLLLTATVIAVKTLLFRDPA
jgi:hypothetical protein